MKPITTSTYTFANIRAGGFLYVDKTRILYELLKPANGIYFLARPRRFGKSLTISTLAAIFAGHRELFTGLAIDTLPYDWKIHPVIRIDLGSKQAWCPAELSVQLGYAVDDNATRHQIQLTRESPHARFHELVTKLATRDGQVVILIDEYDKPILGNIDNPAVGEILTVLKAFYSVVKSCDAQIRFALLTGVSKFSRVSVFSDLNNLTDLTMDSRYAALLGYTQEELEINFAAYIDQVARQQGVERSVLLAKVRQWYNGYRFSKAPVTVYNPVSVGKFFDAGEFANYWFETGTPSFLLKLIKQEKIDLFADFAEPQSELAFAAYEIDRLRALPLLVQTGYLTIRETMEEPRRTAYRLGFPNMEVEEAFTQCLLGELTPVSQERAASLQMRMVSALLAGDLETFFAKLQTFFAGIPYDIQIANEKYYQTVFHAVFRLLGLDVRSEVRTASGRIDATIETPQFVYLFEFKLQGSADDALAQIRDKGYATPFLNGNKTIRLVGVGFDPQTRNLGKWCEGPAV